MHRLAKGFAAALVWGALVPATAGANVIIGNPLNLATDGGNGGGSAPHVFVETVWGDPSAILSSPVNGTVVGWNIRGTSATLGSLNDYALRVLRPSGSGYIGVGTSATVDLPHTAGDDVLRNFVTSLPIRIGDQIGVNASADSLFPSASSGPATFKTFNSFADGSQSGAQIGGGGGSELQFNAVVAATNTIGISALRKQKKKGTATLTATLPNAGTLSVTGKLIKPQTINAAVDGDVGLKLLPNRSARSRLKEKGKASGKVAFTFTPELGDAATQTLRVGLKLKR